MKHHEYSNERIAWANSYLICRGEKRSLIWFHWGSLQSVAIWENKRLFVFLKTIKMGIFLPLTNQVSADSLAP